MVEYVFLMFDLPESDELITFWVPDVFNLLRDEIANLVLIMLKIHGRLFNVSAIQSGLDRTS